MLLLIYSGVIWGQTPNSTDLTEPTIAVQESLYTQDGALKVLPAYTDSLQAWTNRSPRNITNGYYIIIQKGKHKLHLYKHGVLLKTYPVASGKNPKDKSKENDMTTPEGHYNINAIYSSITWRYTSPITGNVSQPGVYGPWFFSLNTSRGSFSGGSWARFGIHGTSRPSSVGRDGSHCCVRMDSKDVTELKNEVYWLTDASQIRVDILN